MIAQTDHDITLAHFNQQLDRYAIDDPRALSWGSRQSQESRLAVLLDIGDLTGKTILDVGCGVGDLYGYLQAHGIDVAEYCGTDINARMIDSARRKYPSIRFEQRDLLDEPFDDGQFDYVVESGIFNLHMPHWQDVSFGTLGAMFRAARIGVAANFLSALSGNDQPDSYYADPANVVRLVSTLSRCFVLRHDYRTNDFTVYIFREDATGRH